MEQHPTPWATEQQAYGWAKTNDVFGFILDANRHVVIPEVLPAIAAHIVAAVNAYAAGEALAKAMLKYDAAIQGCGYQGDVTIQENGDATAEGDDLDSLYEDWLAKARAFPKEPERVVPEGET